ncbi:hypothetical protein IAU59_002918 [Kwoniella sp. CBS 9459]
MEEDDFEDLLRDVGDPEAELSSPEKPPIPKLPSGPPTGENEVSRSNADIKEKDVNEGMHMDVDVMIPSEVPSENELRLAARVAQLEKERDHAKAELEKLQAKYPSYHPTIPVDSNLPLPATSSAEPKLSSTSGEPIEIPHSLIPVLAVLRQHIQELTRDNQALRYTFLGPSPPSRGSIKTSQTPFVSSPLPVPAPAPAPAPTAGPSDPAVLGPPGGDVDMDVTSTASSSQLMPPPASTSPSSDSRPGGPDSSSAATIAQSIDLEKVLDRVKDLIRENEELGELVVQVGQRDDSAWEKALQDSQEVITSLDSDLSHHLSVVQSVRQELDAYKNHFGPLPSASSSSSSGSRLAPSRPSSSVPTGPRSKVDSGSGSGSGSLAIPTGPSALSKGKHPLIDSAPSTPRSNNGSTHSRDGRDRDRDRDRTQTKERDSDRDRDRRRDGPGLGPVRGARGSAGRHNNSHSHERDRERDRRQGQSAGSDNTRKPTHGASLSSRLGPTSDSGNTGSAPAISISVSNNNNNIHDDDKCIGKSLRTTATSNSPSSIVTPPTQGLSILGSAAGKKTGTGGRSDSSLGKVDDRAFKRRK